jgi:hypothetical protein
MRTITHPSNLDLRCTSGVQFHVDENWICVDDGSGNHSPIAPQAVDALVVMGFRTVRQDRSSSSICASFTWLTSDLLSGKRSRDVDPHQSNKEDEWVLFQLIIVLIIYLPERKVTPTFVLSSPIHSKWPRKDSALTICQSQVLYVRARAALLIKIAWSGTGSSHTNSK